MDSLDDFEDYSQMDEEMLNETLREFSRQGDLDGVIELLTSPKLPIKADIHYGDDWSLLLAIENGHTDVVKYLLNSENLKEHADITVNDYYIFKTLCNIKKNLSQNNAYEEILFFIIYEYKMPINDNITNWLLNKHPDIEQLFNKRDLNSSLNKDLNKNIDHPKVKL